MPTPRSKLQMAPARGGLGEGLVFQPPVAEAPAPVVVLQTAAPAEAPAAAPTPTPQAPQPQAAAPVDTYTRETCNYVQTLERGTDRVVRQVPREGFRLCQVGMELRSAEVDGPIFEGIANISTFAESPLRDPLSFGLYTTMNIPRTGIVGEVYANATPTYNTTGTLNTNLTTLRLGLGLTDYRAGFASFMRYREGVALELEYTHVNSVNGFPGTTTVEGSDVVRLNFVDRSSFSLLSFQIGPLHFAPQLAVTRIPITLVDGGGISGTVPGSSATVSDSIPKNPLSFLNLNLAWNVNRPASFRDVSPLYSPSLTTADRVQMWTNFLFRFGQRYYAGSTTIAGAIAVASSRNAFGDGDQYKNVENATVMLSALAGVTGLSPLIEDGIRYLTYGTAADRVSLASAAGLEIVLTGLVGFFPNLFEIEPTSPEASAARMDSMTTVGTSLAVGVGTLREGLNQARRIELNNPEATNGISLVIDGSFLAMGFGLLIVTNFGQPNADSLPATSTGTTQAQLEDMRATNDLRAGRNYAVSSIGYALLFEGLMWGISDIRGYNARSLNVPSPARTSSLPPVAANHPDAVYLNGSGRLAPNGRYLTGLNASLRGLPGGALLSVGFHL